ncbi:MAG: CpaF family protein [Planctomycetia bacterium]|nr:CpaF family protein [Planctomycetia bacterium]
MSSTRSEQMSSKNFNSGLFKRSRNFPKTQETEFQRIKTAIHREVLDAIDLNRLGNMEDEQLIKHVRRIAERVIAARKSEFQEIDRERLLNELVAESFGLGPLEPYMKDPEITDILANGPYEVYIEKHGILELTPTKFADEDHLMQIIQRVVARVGRRVDEQTPMVDARLEDGSRVNAIIHPLALSGPVLSIRRFGNTPLTMDDLVNYGSFPREVVSFLQAVVQGKINIMISGGTGSGKTTLLNCISRFIPDGERLITIEDSAELKLQRTHVVALESRMPNNEGLGGISARALVRNALRMRPDRIILGEVRGEEALDMLQAMNTGHEGSMTTIHANSVRDSLSRLEVMVNMAGFEIPVSVIHRYISSAITVVVQLARLQGGARRVMSVSEISGEEGKYEVKDIFRFQQEGIDAEGRARGHFLMTGHVPTFLSRLKEQGILLPPEFFTARNL